MDKKLRSAQIIIGAIAIFLTFSMLSLGLGAGGRAPDPPASVQPSPVPPRKVDEGSRMPGVPERPIADIAAFPLDHPANPDRQLDYKPASDPQVKFEDSLGKLEDYAAQGIEWTACEDDPSQFCATILAPLDWEAPEGEAVSLAVRRVPSGNPKHGTLFVNPGGPGAPGTDYAASMEADQYEGYDIVGWDPRGTGRSTAVQCGTTEEMDKLYALDSSPDDEAEDKTLQEGYRSFAQQCRDSSGKLLDHVTSEDVVRDMDLMRHLVGDDKLNFLGVSYGTFIGALYAEMFPSSSGRLILDAAVEITDEEPIFQIEGFEQAFRAWADWCAGQEACVLTGEPSEKIQERVSDWLQHLDENPIKIGDRALNQGLAATGIAFFLYGDETAYRSLAETLQVAMQGNGETLLAASDQLNGRGPDQYEPIAYAFPAMHCVDRPDEGVEFAPEDLEEALAKAPMLGRHMGLTYVCELWTADSLPNLKITAKGASPILVVGSTGDSATPYEQAVRMAKQLEPATLLTYEGAGHGIVSGGNACVREVVDRYLDDGTVPEEGKRCK